MKTLRFKTGFATALVLALMAGPAQKAQSQAILASTYNFTTPAGTAQADGHLAGLPTAATSIFDRGFFDAPLTDPDDPLGTARHELFHGIGFGSVYDLFSAHLRAVSGEERFNSKTDGTGTELAVMLGTTGPNNLSHLKPTDYSGRGGSYVDQRYLLMTPAPDSNGTIPYPVDAKDVSLLNSAFNWAGIGGVQINVVFDNSAGTWSAAEKARINQAVGDDQGAFGAPNGNNVFTWTVLIPEPSVGSLLVLGILAFWRRTKLRS